jgi:hypothetical protein
MKNKIINSDEELAKLIAQSRAKLKIQPLFGDEEDQVDGEISDGDDDGEDGDN